jgi:hypothetical protein
MSKEMLVSIGILVLVFGSGVAIGLFMGDSPSVSVSPDIGNAKASSGYFIDAAAQQRNDDNTLLSSRIRELEKELSDQKQDPTVILADRLAFCKKFPNQLGFQAFGDDLKVTPVMAEFLKLSPEEQEALEMHLAQIHDKTVAIEKARVVFSKQPDGGFTYKIPAFPEGKELQEQLTNLITYDIGTDRAGVFLGQARWGFSEDFADFGAGEMTVQIKRTDQPNASTNVTPAYSLAVLHANGSGMETSIGSSPILPARYNFLTQSNPVP